MFNTHTTTHKLRRICCGGTKPELTLLERLDTEIWKLNGNIFFKLFFSDLDEKITFAGYERHTKGNNETSLSCLEIYLPCRVSHENQKYSLTLNNFSLSSPQLVPNYFLYPSKGSDVYLRKILAQFSPNKHSSTTPRHLAIVETRLKSWKRRTAKNYSRSIIMLLTWNWLHFSWSYWLPKILLLPYKCDGIIGCCSNSIHKHRSAMRTCVAYESTCL